MLQKSQIFSFLLSLIVTFTLGFFVWNMFITPNNSIFSQVLGEANQMGAKFFPASVSAPDLQQSDEESAPEAVVGDENQNLAVAPAESVQDQLDDIQEKLDVIQEQVNELIAQQKQNSQVTLETEDKNPDVQSPKDLDKDNDQSDNNQDDNQNTNNLTDITPPTSGGGSGGGSAPVAYSKILISEVQISPISQRFVELYNPNVTDVDLTGWYLQRKTATGSDYTSFVTKNNFAGKTIKAGNYFLISRSDITADITLADLTITPNNFLALKSPEEKIVDQMGFGDIADDLSWCDDFSVCSPTPKAQNIAYVVPPAPADTIAPVITLIGASEVVITVGDIYADEGATASDNVDGEITANIATVNPVDANAAGDYIITYNVSDAAGNSAAEATRLVRVVAAPPASNNATVTSAVYTVSPLATAAGTITNVSFGTPKVVFLNNLIFAAGALENTTSSSLGDPIVSGDALVVTAQDGTTQAIYTISVAMQDITPPAIISFYPSDNSIDVPVDVQPTLTFSEALDHSTVKSSNIQLREYATLASDAKAVPAALTLSQDGAAVGFYLSSPLQYNKQYYFFVGSGVKDIAGNSFAKNTWYHAQRDEHEFTTLIDTTSPSNL